MKKHISVWMLLARSSLLPVSGICAGTAAVQTLLFGLAMRTQTYWETPAPEIALAQSRAGFTGLLSFCLTALCVMRCGSMTSPRSGYTLCRLRISERMFCLWHALHAALCLLIWWAVQALTLTALCTLWTLRCDPAGTQTVFLAVWRTPYFYNLLPLSDWVRWLRNLLLLAAMGCAAADAARFARRRARGWWLPVLLGAAAAAFAAGELFYPVCLCLLSAGALYGTLRNIIGRDECDEEA